MIGFIDSNGKYVRKADEPMPHDISPQFKGWSHDNQRKRLGADIVQPYVDTNKPNREFIEIYRGDVANRYFTQDQIDKAEREML